MNKKNKYYELKKEKEGIADLYIFGDIVSEKWFESDVAAFDIVKDLLEIDTPINVHINSYGGEVSQGLAIYNVLKKHPHEVVTYCEGFACSAASIVFMAGDKRIMPKSSLLLIHNAWTMAVGDSNELKKAAEDLDKITKPSIEIYKSVSNLSESVIKDMLNKEEWITADEALGYGFATSIEKKEEMQCLHDHILQKTIMRNKELEKELQSKDVESVDGWASFLFGTK